MRIYISIPITGLDLLAQVRAASKTAENIQKLGHRAFNPFDTHPAPEGYDESEKYAYYMGRDIEQLLLCDAVLFCKGYKSSKGCRAEEQIAQIYGIKRYYSIKDIEDE